MEFERKIKRAKEQEKTRGDWGRGRGIVERERKIKALSLALFFARAPLSERLEQARTTYQKKARRLKLSPTANQSYHFLYKHLLCFTLQS